MCLGWYFGVLALLLLWQTCQSLPFQKASIKDCRTLQQGTEECHYKYNVSIYQGDSKSFSVLYHTTEQILFSRCDSKTGELQEQSIGRPWKLRNLANEAGVSLINQNMTVKNAKKTNEGIYIISSHKSGKCLEQVNLIVLDLPPPEDVTPTSNVNRSTVSPSGSNGLYIAFWVPAVVIIIIIIIIILAALLIKCLKKNNSPHEYTASSQSASTAVSELVVNGFGQHQPQKSHLSSESKL